MSAAFVNKNTKCNTLLRPCKVEAVVSDKLFLLP